MNEESTAIVGSLGKLVVDRGLEVEVDARWRRGLVDESAVLE